MKREAQRKIILFVCVENAARSQMAEAFFNKYSPEGYHAVSAGTRSISEINPAVVEVMKELGNDINSKKSKKITDEMIRKCTKIVNMGCMDKESCPALFLHDFIDWNIEDPKGKSIEKVREIRDDINQRVKKLVTDLNRQEINN